MQQKKLTLMTRGKRSEQNADVKNICRYHDLSGDWPVVKLNSRICPGILNIHRRVIGLNNRSHHSLILLFS